MSTDTMEPALERLIIEDPCFDQLAQSLKVFCPFDAMGVTRQEIRHAHFLSYVLDPQRPHGFGPDCLREFMWETARTLRQSGSAVIAPLEVHLMELDGAVVRREYKSIDLLLEIPQHQLVLAIELKIDATEHSGQLGRYRRVVESEWPAEEGWKHLFLFLTKRGDAPSEDGAGWQSLSLEAIADALGRIARRKGGRAEASGMLESYVAMLRREHLVDERMEDLARALWREHKEALEFLMERRPDPISTLLAELWVNRDKVALQLSEKLGLVIVPDQSTKANIRFAVRDWDDVPGMTAGTYWKESKRILVCEVQRYAKDRIRVQFQISPGEQGARARIFEALKGAGLSVGGNWALNPQWRQLATSNLLKLEQDALPEDAYAKLVQGLTEFLMKHVPGYSDALSKIGSAAVAEEATTAA